MSAKVSLWLPNPSFPEAQVHQASSRPLVERPSSHSICSWTTSCNSSNRTTRVQAPSSSSHAHQSGPWEEELVVVVVTLNNLKHQGNQACWGQGLPGRWWLKSRTTRTLWELGDRAAITSLRINPLERLGVRTQARALVSQVGSLIIIWWMSVIWTSLQSIVQRMANTIMPSSTIFSWRILTRTTAQPGLPWDTVTCSLKIFRRASMRTNMPCTHSMISRIRNCGMASAFSMKSSNPMIMPSVRWLRSWKCRQTSIRRARCFTNSA